MHYKHRITIEATTAEEAARELCGHHITPSSNCHLLTQCDMEYIEALATDMRERGWKGAPVLVTDSGEVQPYLINGRHRCVAACLAGIPIEMWHIPWEDYDGIDMDGEDMEKAYIPRDAWI